MINIFVLVTILGHLPVILSAKSKGSEDMKQILIVEDDSFLNKMLDYNLTADGYGVTSALNARTAADAIRQREFDLVLLDINLPDGNGFELCRLIKPQHPDTIVIFLTANDQESDQIRGYEVGAVDYITKPFVIGALQRKIKAMFAMLEHHKPAKDIYDDGRLFLDFSEQAASLNGKPLTLSPMDVLPVELDGDTVDQKFLDEIVYLLGLEDKLKNMPNNLSGGQQQRVAIARALITKSAIVLADEPTGNLDSKTSAEVMGLIKRTSAEFRQTVVMITHNNDIARLADRIVRIEDGKIVE